MARLSLIVAFLFIVSCKQTPSRVLRGTFESSKVIPGAKSNNGGGTDEYIFLVDTNNDGKSDISVVQWGQYWKYTQGKQATIPVQLEYSNGQFVITKGID